MLAGCGSGGFRNRKTQHFRDPQDRDRVRNVKDAPHEGVEHGFVAFFRGGAEGHSSAVEFGDIGGGGCSDDLDESRGNRPAVRELVDLAGGVLGEDVDREEVLEREYGEVLRKDFPHSGVVDGEDCDRHSPVDLARQMRLRGVVVARGAFPVLGQILVTSKPLGTLIELARKTRQTKTALILPSCSHCIFFSVSPLTSL